MNYGKRVKKLQKYLRKNGLGAFLITQPENRRYLCGYSDGDHGITETSGVLLVPAKSSPYLLTDFRYKIQAENEVIGAEVLLYPKGLMALLETLLADLSIKKLAFESSYMLHSAADRLKKLGKKIGFSIVAKLDVVERMRLIKDADEIEFIRKSVQLNEQVFQKIHGKISPKLTEIDLALLIESTMIKMGASGPSFSSIVASGTNSALPHAVPTIKKIKKGQPLTIDMGLILDGYCSDMTRNLCPVKATKKYKKIHRIVREAQLAGMAAVAPGVKACDVDKVARTIIKETGYGKNFGHSLGHGVGLAVHEGPGVSTKSKRKLKAGMVITIEPGVYVPDWGGIRLENMVLVTENGYENLNSDTTFLDI